MDKIQIQEHFQVPEGYFQQFEADLMKRLPERPFIPVQRKPFIQRMLRPISIAAVGLFAASVAVYSYFSAADDIDAQAFAPEKIMINAENFDDAADYVAIDRHDIRYYMMIED